MDAMKSSDDFDDDDDEEEERIDTSWFLTKEEMMNFLNDPARNERKILNPTEAIYQHGRQHRGFTQIIKTQQRSPTIIEETIDSLSNDFSDLDANKDNASSPSSPDGSFLSLQKPRMPGPVLTYRQLSEIYDRPHETKSTYTSSPTPTAASTVASSRSSTSPVSAPVSAGDSPRIKSSPSKDFVPRNVQGSRPMRHSKIRAHKVTNFLENLGKEDKHRKRRDVELAKVMPTYLDFVNDLRTSLRTGIVLPLFSLFVNCSSKSLHQIHHDDEIDQFHHPEEDVQALQSMHIALFKAHVVDNVDLLNLNRNTAKGQAVLRRRQRALEEELLMLSLDFLTTVELFTLKAVSKSWNTLVHLKFHLSQDLTLQPSDPKMWCRYHEGTKHCNIHDLLSFPENSINKSSIETFVSPKMIECVLADSAKMHYVNITRASTTEATAGHEAQSPQLPFKRSIPSPRISIKSSGYSPPSKSHSSLLLPHMSGSSLSARPPCIPDFVYTSLNSSNTSSTYGRLRSLSLISVVLDLESIESLKSLHVLDSVKLHFVKIRRGGVEATCRGCSKDGLRLVDMILCEGCRSIESACCSQSCYTEYHPFHMNRCVLAQKIGMYGSARKSSTNVSNRNYKVLADRDKYDSDEDDTEHREFHSVLRKENAKGIEKDIGCPRTRWLDGDALKNILDAIGESLTSLSLHYILPADSNEAKHLCSSFNSHGGGNHLFSGVPGLKNILIREVHESLAVSPVGLSDDMVKRRIRDRKKMTKTVVFGANCIVSLSQACPNLQVIDVSSSSCDGRLLPVRVNLEAMLSISAACNSLKHLGYFSVEKTKDFVSMMLLMDDKLKWPSLSSFSCLVSVCDVQHTLRITCAKSWIGDPRWEHHKVDQNRTFNYDEDEENELIDGVDKFMEEFGSSQYENSGKLSSSDSESSSSDDDGDDDNKYMNGADEMNLQYASQQQTKYHDYTLRDRRKGCDGISEDDKLDGNSFIRHLVGLTFNALKHNEVHASDENQNSGLFVSMKTILLNRQNLKVGNSSELRKSCAFFPKNTEDNEEFYIIALFTEAHGATPHCQLSVVDTSKHCTNISKSFACSVEINPCYESRFLGVGEIKQTMYYTTTLNISEDPPETYPGNFCSTSTLFTVGNRVAIKVNIKLGVSCACTKLGMGSLLSAINSMNENEYILLKSNTRLLSNYSDKHDISIKIGSKAEECFVDEYHRSNIEGCLERSALLASHLDAQDAYVQNMPEDVDNIFPVCIDQDLTYITVIKSTTVMEQNVTAPFTGKANLFRMRSPVQFKKESVNGDSDVKEDRKMVSDDSQVRYEIRRPFQNRTLPQNIVPVPALLIRIGSFQLSFDPKKKAKAKERERERLNQNLLRAAKLAKPKGVSKDEKYATDIRVSSPGSTSPSPSRKNKRSVLSKSNGNSHMRSISYQESVKKNSFKLEKESKLDVESGRNILTKAKLVRYDCINCGGEKCVDIKMETGYRRMDRRGFLHCSICHSSFSSALHDDDNPEMLMLYWRASFVQ